MADLVPFRGLRFRTADADLSAVIAPPYDVISAEQQANLYDRDPHNVIRLEYSREPVPQRYEAVASELAAWRAAGVLQPEASPALYRYTQRFTHDGTDYTRTAVIGRVRLEPLEAGGIRPHEFTMAGPKEDRLALLSATGTNISPVYALMHDVQGALADAVSSAPAVERAGGTDIVGQQHEVEVITDAHALARITAAVVSQPLYIADGHHRYETALAYQAAHPQNPAAAYTMMAITPAADPGLLILPIHRIVTPRIHPADLVEQLAASFSIEDVGALDDAQTLAHAVGELAASQTSLTIAVAGLRAGRLTLLRLRDRAAIEARMPTERSPAWKCLAVNVLQFGILEPLLGIDAATLDAGAHVRFSEDAHEAVEAVRQDAAPLAFLVPATRPDELIAVADAADRMPQKSTYFYPKLGTGLVLNAHQD